MKTKKKGEIYKDNNKPKRDNKEKKQKKTKIEMLYGDYRAPSYFFFVDGVTKKLKIK